MQIALFFPRKFDKEKKRGNPIFLFIAELNGRREKFSLVSINFTVIYKREENNKSDTVQMENVKSVIRLNRL